MNMWERLQNEPEAPETFENWEMDEYYGRDVCGTCGGPGVYTAVVLHPGDEESTEEEIVCECQLSN